MTFKIIKSFLVAIVAFSVSTLAHATAAGLYLEALLGMSNTHNPPVSIPAGAPPTTPSNTGFGGGVSFGYNYNQYVALEGGYVYYANSTYSPATSTTCSNPQIHTSAINILGKGVYPIGTFGVFAKAGFAVIRVSKAGSLVSDSTGCGTPSKTTTSARPMAGFGVSYDATQNWVVDFSVSRVFGNSSIKNADLAAIGISYHFVDKYCGQFLC